MCKRRSRNQNIILYTVHSLQLDSTVPFRYYISVWSEGSIIPSGLDRLKDWFVWCILRHSFVFFGSWFQLKQSPILYSAIRRLQQSRQPTSRTCMLCQFPYCHAKPQTSTDCCILWPCRGRVFQMIPTTGSSGASCVYLVLDFRL